MQRCNPENTLIAAEEDLVLHKMAASNCILRGKSKPGDLLLRTKTILRSLLPSGFLSSLLGYVTDLLMSLLLQCLLDVWHMYGVLFVITVGPMISGKQLQYVEVNSRKGKFFEIYKMYVNFSEIISVSRYLLIYKTKYKTVCKMQKVHINITWVL